LTRILFESIRIDTVANCALKDRVMFFMLRCLFWLSLVYMALPWDGVSLRADLTSHAQQASRVIVREAQDICAKDPIGCATQAIALGKAFDIASLASASASQNTLRPADLAPAWRGPATVTASRH
jgi:hypothetical protein